MTSESRLLVSLRWQPPTWWHSPCFVLYCAFILFPDSILYSLRAKACLLLLYPPSCALGSPSENCTGAGQRGSHDSQEPPWRPSLLWTPSAGHRRTEGSEGIAVYALVSKEIFFSFIVEVLILKLKHRRSTKGMSHLECSLFSPPCFQVKSNNQEANRKETLQRICEWLWQVKAAG